MVKAVKKHTRSRTSSEPNRTDAPDPILLAIATHRRLDRAWRKRSRAADAAGIWHEKAPEIDLASDAAEEAAWKMARTTPTTTAGAAIMLNYIVSGTNGLFDMDEYDWHETAFRTVATALRKITGSRRAA
jgi:hypothetical protein